MLLLLRGNLTLSGDNNYYHDDYHDHDDDYDDYQDYDNQHDDYHDQDNQHDNYHDDIDFDNVAEDN